jgi:hypothetical protein
MRELGAVLLAGAALDCGSSGQTLMSADGLWRAGIDSLGQVDDFYSPDQPASDVLAHTTVYEASPDSMGLSRTLSGNYVIVAGPIVDPDQTHSYTRLENAVGGGDPPSGDCCFGHGAPGCEDAACESAVCGSDSFCCDVEWDQACAKIAQMTPACACVGKPFPISIEIENFMVSGPQGGVLVKLRAINDSPSDSVTVKLFYYCDYDIVAPDDEAMAIFQDGRLLAIEQFEPSVTTLWYGACPNYKSWEIDEWPDLLNSLNAGIAQLSGADGTPPGPNDHTAALSSPAATLGPGEALEMRVAMGAPGFSACMSSPDCPWDLDGDEVVGITDLLDLLPAWGTNPGGPPDFDGDANVGIVDLLSLLSHWGPCP